MNKLLVHLVLVVSSIILISGCTSGGSEIAEEEVDAFFGPLPSGLPVFVDIDEPYLGTSSLNEDELALFSYAPQETAASSATDLGTEVFSTDSNIAVSLNTQPDSADSASRSEFTLLVKNDSIYLVNHLSDEIRLLNHFTTQVCDILPIDIVKESVNSATNQRVLATFHAERVYIVTADDGGTTTACNVDSKKRYYELPLDHQLEPSVAEGGTSAVINLVSESLARSKLIFGLVPDPDDSAKDIMDYAYLGYDSESKFLSLFDKDRDLVWTQKRVLQEFDRVDFGQGQVSPKYMFHVRQLSNQFYLIQLGLDVFVVDSGLDLLSKKQSDVATILADKVVSLAVGRSSEFIYASPAYSLVDNDDLIIVDNAKIYHIPYLANATVRVSSQDTRIVHHDPISIDSKQYLYTPSFSQFDLKQCDGDIECQEANDVEAQNWQFFTPCEEQYGCSVAVDVDDLCETYDEWIQTQSNRTRCTPSDYQHIAELNKVANDASLLAYMQYAEKYVRQNHFILNNDQLFITARMSQKDVFLGYNFKLDFSQPKLLREHVFIGKRASLLGMEPRMLNNNLFLTALQASSTKFNECYKNGQKVSCQLGDLDTGSSNNCTGKDLADGICTNQFQEYESIALFCSSEQLNNLSCSDMNLAQLNDLAVEAEDEDAKWLSLYDYSSASYKMYLLAGLHESAVDNNLLDEGKLYSPYLYSIDETNGQIENEMSSFDGSVERVVGGWLSKEPEFISGEPVEPALGVPEVFGHIDVISQEIKQTGGLKISKESSLVTYLLEQTFEGSSPLEPKPITAIKSPKVAERVF